MEEFQNTPTTISSSPLDTDRLTTIPAVSNIAHKSKINDLVFELNEDALCQKINERVQSIFGDVRGQHIEEIFSSQPTVLEQYQKISSGREFIYFEVPNQHIWVIQSIRDKDGSLSGSVITAQAHDEIIMTEIKLLPSAWSYDLLANEVSVSNAVAEVVGFENTKLEFRNAHNVLPEVMSMLKVGCRRLF